jgi:glycosyltransferase involved in cell wall biosynthesis
VPILSTRQAAQLQTDGQARGRVSVVVPTYNYAEYLPQAIQSVLGQTLADWELIVVDDGSTDGTAGVVARFDDGRIRYAYQDNRGPSAARNHGLDLARGEYFTMLDADDWLAPNSLADRAALLDRHPEYGAVYSDGYICDREGRPLGRLSDNRAANYVGDVYNELVKMNFFGTLSPVIVRRKVLTDLGLRHDESNVFVEDWDFLMRLAEHVEFGYVDSVCVWYRQHGRNRTPALSDPRSLDSHARTFLKVVSSARFARLPQATRSRVYSLLVPIYLHGRCGQQQAVMHSRDFRALPRRDQARMTRLAASRYLSSERPAPWTAAWLFRAWLAWPADWKSGLLATCAALSPRATSRLYQLQRLWQRPGAHVGTS